MKLKKIIFLKFMFFLIFYFFPDYVGNNFKPTEKIIVNAEYQRKNFKCAFMLSPMVILYLLVEIIYIILNIY